MSFQIPGSVPDQTGRTIVITGGNSGIGFEAGVVFAQKGAQVVLACRDPRRAEGALAELTRRVPGARARAMRLDLADLASVRAFADELARFAPKLDVLVNNAGVMGLPKLTTKDGFEMQMGTNHFGHFALTMRLLPMLERSTAPRVVSVSSMTHKYGALDFADLDRDRHYVPSDAYATSKLANLLFTYELERKLRARDAKTFALACHPGWAATQITKETRLSRIAPWIKDVLVWGNGLVGQPAERGAWPTIFAAVADVPGGSYVGPSELFGTRGKPAVMRSCPSSYDVETAKRLWDVSEHRTGERFPL